MERETGRFATSASWARRAVAIPADDIERTLLRHRTLLGRDGLARLATYGQLDWSRARAALRHPRRQSWDPAWCASLAHVVGLQNLGSHDLADATALFGLAARLGPLTDRHRLSRVEVLLAQGDIKRARKVIGDLHAPALRLAALDINNPFVSTRGDASAWWTGFNALWTEHGLEPPTLIPGTQAPYDRLRCTPSRTTTSGPLVTVIMTAYQPGPELLHSLDSVLQQSYQNLEILVIDDASGPEADEILERAEARDERIRVIRLKENGGTYRARNVGIEEARGSLVTGQDDDDWSHPRRIEHQVTPLLSDRNLAASWGRMYRVTADLVFHRLGSAPERVSPISLMFRRDIARAIGGFAPARRSADSEFAERLTAATGRAPAALKQPVMLARLSDSSLSSGDFRAGWHHPARIAMRSSWRAWHADIAQGADPIPDSQPSTLRVPRRYRIAQPERDAVDLLVAADWRLEDGATRLGLEVIARAVARGRRVGMLHLPSPWLVMRGLPDLSRTAAGQVNRGTPLAIAGEDDLRSSHLLLLDPLVTDGIDDGVVGPSADRVTVVGSRPERGPSGDLVVDRDRVVSRAGTIFGGDVHWFDALGADSSAGAKWSSRPAAPNQLSVGPARSIAVRPPHPRDLASVAVDLPGCEEDVILDTGDLLLSSEHDVAVWLPAQAQPTLASLWECWEAIVRGVVVVAPPAYRGSLGDGATYAEPDQMLAVAHAIAAQPDALSTRRATASQVIASATLDTPPWLDGEPEGTT